jgi:anti-anti-sigma factor
LAIAWVTHKKHGISAFFPKIRVRAVKVRERRPIVRYFHGWVHGASLAPASSHEEESQMKCYEVKQCTPKERESCYVWNTFKENPADLDGIKCWVMKGAYADENTKQQAACQKCKYYIMMNRESGIVGNYQSDVAIINCEGVLNNDRTKALEQVWDTLKKNRKFKVLLRIEKLNNIYSCGLGLFIKMHRETAAEKGQLIVSGAHGYVMAVLESSKLTKVLKLTADEHEAATVFNELRKKEEEAAKPKVEEVKVKQPEAPKKRPPCYVYFKNHNPRNATNCDECSRKINPSDQPCWIVEGIIEGISFQYVNEDCEECPYYEEFGISQAA